MLLDVESYQNLIDAVTVMKVISIGENDFKNGDTVAQEELDGRIERLLEQRAMKILWSRDASDDLMEIISFIAERSGKKVTRGIYSRMMEKIESIREFPATVGIAPELTSIGITEIHELIEPPWRIFYRIFQNEVRILSVVDGRRNIEEILYRKVIDGKLK